ncbi:lipoate--protein ligase family protein [Spelaeicoccus albus]|uniref:Lipoate-protein ligase A n=1 Tax=Spelaeicoccus albus TaxID=1280376 RepID=A0A7Z0A9S0_9MICO|nr:lipoate--protein ligase family protein [Spelaeicoccus albus]NYI65713.1 lipoate-protein ligase A [Spelaeicoccus albus]
MTLPPLAVREVPTPRSAAAALGGGKDLLDAAREGRIDATLRIYRPHPTVAFGQRDRFLDGFDDARVAAREHGFTPLLRPVGGRAAAFHRGSLVFDHIEPTSQPIARTQDRFAEFAELYRRALASLGVDARTGEIPGEYCAGEHSVNGAGTVKLVGTAQRIVSNAWLFSSVVVVADSAPIRSVLIDVYTALGLEWAPSTAGAVEDLVPGIGIEDVKDAVLAEFARTRRLTR